MNCGTALRAGNAGASIAPKEPASSREDYLGRYLPPELMRKLEAARRQGGMAGERRVITMLFCDVKGSTAAAEQVDPEVWTEVMNGAFERMIRPIYEYEGTVPRLMGDAILAFFGAPVAHEDDPQRAVMAGLAIQSAMRPYVDEMRRTYRLDFGLRVGINTGLVVVGEIGSDLRMEYTAIGDAINLAARMEQTAASGTVQITEETHRLIAPLFDFEALGGIEVKGKAEPVVAYRVLGTKTEPGRLRGLEGLSSPLVGRAAPLRQLLDRLGSLTSGQGAFVAVIGEAGLGKSSLVAAAQEDITRNTRSTKEASMQIGSASELRGSSLLWLRADGVAYSRSVSYFLWRQIIRRSLDASDEEAPVHVRARLGRQCKQKGLQEEDIGFLETMLAVESEETRQALEGYQGEALVERITAGVRHYLTALARPNPLVLVLDDLHWADEASLALLLQAGELVLTQPVIVISMLRPDQDALSWQVVKQAEEKLGSRFSSIALEPLGTDQARALLANLLGIQDLLPRLSDAVLDRAGGNPFFVEELIRSLIETKKIVREDGHWRVAEDVSVMLPDTLRGVLGARIDRLPEAERHVLQMAAVIGRTFDLRVLERLVPADMLDFRIARLEEAGLIVRKIRSSTEHASESMEEIEAAFRHVLIQEAAYDSILIKKRAELHRQVGEALEQLHAGRLEEFAPVLAHHFHAAGDDRSLRYDVLAGDEAARLYANTAAAMHYRRALETALRIGAAVDHVANLYSKLGAVLELAGRYREALATYENMRAYGQQQHTPTVELEALMAQGTIYSTPTALRDPVLAEQTMREALELSTSVGDLGMQTRLNWNMMLNYLHSGRLDPALEYGQQALALARQMTDGSQLAFVLNDLGRVFICRGDFDAAFSVIHEARHLWSEADNRVMLADNLGSEEEALFSMGRYDEVLPVGEKALELCESMDNAWGQSYHRLLMGLAQFGRGRSAEAIELIRQSIELGDRGGLIISSIAGRCDLAWAYGSCGEVEKGLEEVQSATETARANLPDWVVMPIAVKIRLHALRGERAAAEEAASGVRLVPPTLPYPHYTMMVELARVELARLRGDYEGMLAITEEALGRLKAVLPGEAPQLMAARLDALRALGREESDDLAQGR
jgi:class 3 adenylate cyclase/tetratricopeptide (TPR) repeat protein